MKRPDEPANTRGELAEESPILINGTWTALLPFIRRGAKNIKIKERALFEIRWLGPIPGACQGCVCVRGVGRL